MKSMSGKSQALRIIQTARTEKAINEAAAKGFFPLLRKVVPSKEIKARYCVVQDPKTGKINVIGDARDFMPGMKGGKNDVVISWTEYYPYHFPSPYAAYLLPKDLKIGERVILEDLIEDYPGARWIQGNVYRLESCEAIWNGTDLEIQYDPKIHCSTLVG